MEHIKAKPSGDPGGLRAFGPFRSQLTLKGSRTEAEPGVQPGTGY